MRPKARKASRRGTAADVAEPNIHAAFWRGWKFAAPTFVGVAASLLLLWGLDYKYLWQDEAATAVLASRMLRFGKPLAYDGVNLITTDLLSAQDASTVSQLTTNPRTAIYYYTRRGDFKADLSWKWQPWGSFAVCAFGLEVLGKTTLAARLPFALAGIATVLLLYWLVLVAGRSRLMAFLAALFLTLNCYWVLHTRQCRYYSLSSLFLILTLLAYLRRQAGKRWGAVWFVLSAWIWFQCDFGTVWPVWAVLFADAFVAQRRTVRRPAAVGLALAASIAPFAWYYELWGRRAVQGMTWWLRWQYNLFDTNEYVAPIMIVAGSVAVLAWRWKRLPEFERRLVAVACGILVALPFWIASAAPGPFLRYVVMATPLGCLLGAWLVVRLCARRWEIALLGAVVWIVTPWFSLPMHPFLPSEPTYVNGVFFRPELAKLMDEVFGHPDDPNRGTVEWLRKNTTPTDEILIDYEDIPLMFYLPNPIRGGISAFRVEDDAKKPPSVLVMRRSVNFYHVPVFQREIQRYRWEQVKVDIPDLTWGNNPDPIGTIRLGPLSSIIVERRVP